ncbi:MAG: restriction endonuclease, partial [Bacteroidetes bacterium]|nr:restriction endonuclease [Bacteroidota bacterium]
MSKIEEAKSILRELGLPSAQQNEMSALTLLALCGIKKNDSWNDARRISLQVTKGIMNFMAKQYNRTYAPNTRETVRRQVLHQFVHARIADYNPDDPTLPVNSPRAHYAISKAALSVVKIYNTKKWKNALTKFKEEVGELTKKYVKERDMNMIPLQLADG